MAISLKTHKMLWGRAASRCAICQMELVMDASETDDESIIGEACHIVAQSFDGPRGKSHLTPEQRDKYANLILLCNVHHKLIDDQPNKYTIEELLDIKAKHEQSVRDRLDFDPERQREDEVYAGYVEEWERRLMLSQWKQWASWLLSNGQPALGHEMKTALEDSRGWLLSRIWPGRYPELESAFLNFRLVVQDFCVVFSEHAVRRDNEGWETEAFYRIDEWDPELYRKLADDYDFHVALVEDLILELTRAANYICDMVRQFLMRSYRINEGVLLIEGGPYMDLSYKTYRVEYRGEERTERPYLGLEDFKVLRFKRNLYFGEKPEVQQGAPADS